LRLLLADVIASGRFHFIILDCSPSLGVLTMNVLAAAHSVIIPLQAEYYALEGLSVMTRLIKQLGENGVNPGLQLEGIVMTMYDGRTNLSQQVVQEVIRHFGDKVFETLIPRNVRLGEAPSFGKPIIAYNPLCTGASAYRQLAREFLARRNGGVEEEDGDPGGGFKLKSPFEKPVQMNAPAFVSTPHGGADPAAEREASPHAGA
jgi:chromosome partitioning protein